MEAPQFLEPSEIPVIASWIENLKRPGFSWSAASFVDTAASSELFGIPGHCFILFQRLGAQVEILALGTRPQDQGQGLMKQTLLNFYAEMQRDFEEIWLEVHQGNVTALALYTRTGFQQVGERPHYYGPGESALLMTRRLPSP